MLDRALKEITESNAMDDLERIEKTVDEILQTVSTIKQAQYNIPDSDVDAAHGAIKDILTDLFYDEKIRLNRIAGNF